ncbi:WbqC-like protein family protein [Rhizobiales bacterium GAS191]|nr:WbqC-like protein family protein [Rhizobiales bacterium GAS191]
MKLGIMQPYFFPYLGHFALIAAVDEWIVFDVTQYTRRSWINRNRVLHAEGNWQYISVSLKNSSSQINIVEAEIVDSRRMEKHVLGKISHYKRHAPYYGPVCEIVRSTFAGLVNDSLVSLNVRGLSTVCNYLGLPFRYRVCSQLGIDRPEKPGAGEWAPWIAAKLGADVYINPIGGRELFKSSDFDKRGVSLWFLDFEPFIYDTPGYTFEKSLSILDVLMWNSPAAIVRALRKNSLLIFASELK